MALQSAGYRRIGVVAIGLSVDFKSNPTLLLLVAAYIATTFFYRSIRFDERLSQALVAVARDAVGLAFDDLQQRVPDPACQVAASSM
jgi:hypothetical protein